jgi:outer membrane receptor for monomeric catechols
LSGTYPIRASVSYVTGANSLKAGMLRTWYTTNDNNFDPNAMNYTFNNGTPTRLQLVNKPQNIREQHTTYGIYAQDSWTLKRLTLQGGIRYDRMTQVFPEQVVGFTPFVPNGFTNPKSDGVNWNDITPRFSAAYDLTGDGKTAIKGSVGKYMLAQDGGATFGSNLNPQLRMAVGTVNRSWNDTFFAPAIHIVATSAGLQHVECQR